MNPVNVGICGLGTVGGGTFNVLKRNADTIRQRVGRDVRITRVAARQANPACDLTGIALTNDIMDIARADDVDIVVELIGGYEAAFELVKEAIRNGKHVVTANKALIAVHGNELFALAKEKGVTIAFEAGVAGGVPIIKALREGLTANKVESLAGIINGTGNFIMTEMAEKGRAFNDVLAEAQALGYAEADPTFDVEGIDAAHKLTILASIAFGIPLHFKKVYTEGISHISQDDVQYAEELGYAIKHLGVARRAENGVEMRVHPTLIPSKRLLANVNGVLNAVQVQGDAVGPTMYYGPGAGSEPTASAVIADIIDIARQMESGYSLPPLGVEVPDDSVRVLDIEEVVSAYYLRMNVADQVGTMAAVAQIMRDNEINIEAIIQKEPKDGHNMVTLVMLTKPVQEKRLNDAIAKLADMPQVMEGVTRIRVESLEG